MAIIKIYDGTTFIGVEVTEEFAAQYADMEHREYLINRKETRRHQSLDKSMEHGFDVPDPRENLFDKVERNERNRELYRAIALLPSEHQQLLRQVYFEYISQTEIAASQGVTKSAINKRLSRILARLKKFLS